MARQRAARPLRMIKRAAPAAIVRNQQNARRDFLRQAPHQRLGAQVHFGNAPLRQRRFVQPRRRQVGGRLAVAKNQAVFAKRDAALQPFPPAAGEQAEGNRVQRFVGKNRPAKIFRQRVAPAKVARLPAQFRLLPRAQGGAGFQNFIPRQNPLRRQNAGDVARQPPVSGAQLQDASAGFAQNIPNLGGHAPGKQRRQKRRGGKVPVDAQPHMSRAVIPAARVVQGYVQKAVKRQPPAVFRNGGANRGKCRAPVGVRGVRADPGAAHRKAESVLRAAAISFSYLSPTASSMSLV